MKNRIEKEHLEKILTALGRQIGVHEGSPIHIVVCGGSALIFLGLTDRATTDIDILGQVVAHEQPIQPMKKLPQWFQEAAAKVKRDFNLPDDWINTGPTSQVTSGLPSGMKERLTEVSYGTYLTVSFIGRLDQIFLKLYASVDRGGYHVDDLLNLKPSKDEMKAASLWVMTQDVSQEFKYLLTSFLEQKGFSHVAEEL